MSHLLSPDLDALLSIDWDFAGATTSHSTHKLHPYPAKYIPQIPRALIKELSFAGETVVDVFCGSGTTLVEALTLQRHAVGVDANPLACLISEAKTTRFAHGDEKALLNTADRARTCSESIRIKKEGLFFDPSPFVSSATRPLDEAISFWFEGFVIEELAEILSWCRALSTEASRKVALTAFSAIVVSVSRQDSDTRYVRREKNLSPGDVFLRFARSLEDATRAVAEFTRRVDRSLRTRVIQANILKKPAIGEVDLVVCSPPYPNAYSYHLYHMTRMLWLGMDQPTFKQEEIGSHRKYSRKGANGATEETFRTEMGLMFDWLRSHLRAGRYACFVVGDSIIKGQKINNANLMSEVACERGFREVSRIERRLQDTKKAFNPAIGKIKQEHILVLQNESGEPV